MGMAGLAIPPSSSCTPGVGLAGRVCGSEDRRRAGLSRRAFSFLGQTGGGVAGTPAPMSIQWERVAPMLRILP